MAQIFRREGSPFWYGRFQFQGRDIVFSTHKRDKRDAHTVLKLRLAETKGTTEVDDLFGAVLHSLDRLARGAANDEQRLRLNQKRHEMALRLVRAQAQKLPVADAWQAWLDSPRKRNPAASTLGMYGGVWRRFERWARERKIEFLHELASAHAEDYLALL